MIPDDDCKLVETLNQNVNRFRSVHCFVFYKIEEYLHGFTFS